jgi:hypothetical protein
VKKLTEQTQAAITAGKLQPFRCPVPNHDGKEVECKGGDHLADDEVLGMNLRRASRLIENVADRLRGPGNLSFPTVRLGRSRPLRRSTLSMGPIETSDFKDRARIAS